MEDASGEGQQECWFGEKGCHESSKMESGSWRHCCQNAVNPATTVYGDKPGSKLDWWWWWVWVLFLFILPVPMMNMKMATALQRVENTR